MADDPEAPDQGRPVIPSPRGPGSLRFRLTAVATGVTAVVLAVIALVLLILLQGRLTANLDSSLEQRADALTERFLTEISSTPLNTNDEDRAIQLVAADGQILAATTNLAEAPALVSQLDPTRRQVIDTRFDLPLEDDSYRLLSRRIDTPEGTAVLHLAENSDDLQETIRNLMVALFIAVPVVAGILALVMWWLTGRTLEPVDRIRAEVEAITATNSDQRIQLSMRDDEIGRLGSTMNRMLDRLTDATERQRQFVADAAHELRTPLTRIRANLDVDLARPESADAMATLRAVREDAIDLQQLIDDLLHLARSDAGETPRRREPVDLDDLVLEEIREIRTSCPTITIDASGISAAHLAANPDHLCRAVRNLLTNAVRHARSSVTVTLAEEAGIVNFVVADDGPGVPVEDQTRIFERFARVQDARTRSDGGTGLGLAITRDIVESHGGTVVYDNDYDVGARFVVQLSSLPSGWKVG